jgi:hypothetical protein
VAGRSDPDAWAAAADAWAALGRPHRTAYAQLRQAQALLAAGHRNEAHDRLRHAAAAAQGHAPLLAQIRNTADLARLHLDQHQPPGEPAPRTG